MKRTSFFLYLGLFMWFVAFVFVTYEPIYGIIPTIYASTLVLISAYYEEYDKEREEESKHDN